jgi:hypothetical protein
MVYLFAVSSSCGLRLLSRALPDFVTEIRYLLGDVSDDDVASMEMQK